MALFYLFIYSFIYFPYPKKHSNVRMLSHNFNGTWMGKEGDSTHTPPIRK